MDNSTILIVDDDADVLKLLEIELSSEGYQVIKADSGHEAIDKAQKFFPDLIVMDITMPDLNGGEVIKLLKTKKRMKDIPVIFLTAMLSSSEVKGGTTGLNIDGTYYPAIAKPFNGPELLAAVKKILAASH